MAGDSSLTQVGNFAWEKFEFIKSSEGLVGRNRCVGALNDFPSLHSAFDHEAS